MTWHMTGQWHELCSCKMLCPCWLGPAEPDQGWCSGTVIFDIQRGNAGGVDLSGRKVVFVADWPGDFWAGNGSARLYIDEGANKDQFRELEAIFSGKQGGPMAAAGGTVSKWLPAQGAAIGIQWGDTTTVTVSNVAQLRSEQLKDQAGKPTTVEGGAAMAAFQFEKMGLARSDGSHWSDPEMRRWESGGSGTKGNFSWRV